MTARDALEIVRKVGDAWNANTFGSLTHEDLRKLVSHITNALNLQIQLEELDARHDELERGLRSVLGGTRQETPGR